MLRDGLSKAVDFVTDHNVLTLVVMVLLTGAVLAGIPQLDTESQAGADSDAFEDIETVEKSQYIHDRYGQTQDAPERTFETVYVQQSDGNVLSKESLLTGLRYQRTIRSNESVSAALYREEIVGVSNIVAKRAAGDRNATLEEQIQALDARSPAEIQQLVESTLSTAPQAQRLLPSDHDPSSATATDRRMLLAFDASVDEETRTKAEAALYESANDQSDAGVFVITQQAYADYRGHFFTQMVELVVPAALILILGVLAFAYRDLVDIVVGMIGVVLSVLWMFGLLGWMGVAAGLVSIVPVVLVTGLSIDFGFHVFNRYREQRGVEEGIREPMSRGVKLVATALVLVTITAAIGFLANLANPLAMIRNLSISITLGVAAALLIFVTVVPALKISIDGLLERVGLDRRKRALGHGRFLEPILRSSVTVARRGAVVVLLVAVVVGAAGGAAWIGLDEKSFQQPDGEVAEWKQQLPSPLGWETDPLPRRADHVQTVYQPASADAAIEEPILIEGEVTGSNALEDLRAGVEVVRESDLLVDQPGVQAVASPLTAMERVAQRDEAFAAVFREADTDGNGVPDTDLTAVYDALYAADSEVASRVVERTDGQYKSLLVRLALDADYAEAESVVGDLDDAAAVMAGDGERSATVAGNMAVNEAVLGNIVGGILQTMAIALVAIVLTLAAVFRYMHGSATLGLVVAVPIALVMGLVIGGMYLLSIPLTLLTALLMSLVIGLGVDYNIHVGDRFADERRAGKPTMEALEAAVTGTGGALLGSTLTSAGAFATMALVPHPQLESFSQIVVVALVTAFLVSVLVLPSLLVLWDRYVPETVAEASGASDTVALD